MLVGWARLHPGASQSFVRLANLEVLLRRRWWRARRADASLQRNTIYDTRMLELKMVSVGPLVREIHEEPDDAMGMSLVMVDGTW